MKAYTTTYDPQRPPLLRLDSKSNLSPRLGGYPNQQGGGQFRPGQPRPQFPGSPQYGARPALQRNPSSGQFSLPPNQGTRSISPNQIPGLRPVTPYPRAQQQPASIPRSPTNLYQQKSFPGDSPQFNKEQTLDTNLEATQIKDGQEYSVQSSHIIEEEEPMSILNVAKEIEEGHDAKYETGNIIDDVKIEDNPPRPESRNQRNYVADVVDRKSPLPPPQPVDNPAEVQEIKASKPDSLNIQPVSVADKIIVNEEKKKGDRKSPSPEPPKTPRTPKMTLNFEEQNRPKSPKMTIGKGEIKSPTTPAKKSHQPEKSKMLKPETLRTTTATNKRNGLLKSPSKSGDFFRSEYVVRCSSASSINTEF